MHRTIRRFEDGTYELVDPAHLEAWRSAREIAALDRLENVVRDLLKWARRSHGGDPTLTSEEFYIETEEADRRLAELDAARMESGR